VHYLQSSCLVNFKIERNLPFGDYTNNVGENKMAQAALKKPFALKQHVKASEHQGIGNADSAWNWEPKVPKHQIDFSKDTASNRTRTNTNGIADQGEYY
jgi:hypothetical protein